MTYYDFEFCDKYTNSPMEECRDCFPEFYMKEYIETEFTEEQRAKFYESAREHYHIDFENEDAAEFEVYENDLFKWFVYCVFFTWKRELHKPLVFPDPLKVFTE